MDKGPARSDSKVRRRAAVFRPAHVWCLESGIDNREKPQFGPDYILFEMRKVIMTGRAMDQNTCHFMLRKMLEEDAVGFFDLFTRSEKASKRSARSQRAKSTQGRTFR
jgi:hypothetical protein